VHDQVSVETHLRILTESVVEICPGVPKTDSKHVQYDSGSGLVLVDVQTRNQIAVIDPRSDRIVRRIAVPSCDSDHSLYVDSVHRLAFVTCDRNATLLTLNLRTMRFTGRFKVGDSPDVLAFDSSLRRLYVAAVERGGHGVRRNHARRSAARLRLSRRGGAHRCRRPRDSPGVLRAPAGSKGGPQLLIMRPG
jgi:DNA-binding beta-propeller fold protein YncE